MSNPQPNFEKRRSKREIVREILSDHQWHRASELNAAVGWAFNQRVNELRRNEGLRIERVTKDGEVHWYKWYPPETLFPEER